MCRWAGWALISNVMGRSELPQEPHAYPHVAPTHPTYAPRPTCLRPTGGITRVSEALEVIDKSARLDAATTEAASRRASSGGDAKQAEDSIEFRCFPCRPARPARPLTCLPAPCWLPNVATTREPHTHVG